MFSKDIYRERRNRLKELLCGDGLVVLLGNNESPMNYPSNCYNFIQDSNFLYFVGLDLPNLAAIFDLENGTERLYGEDSTVDSIIWTGELPSTLELAKSVGIDYSSEPSEFAKDIAKAIKGRRKIHFLPLYRAEQLLLMQEATAIDAKEINSHHSTSLSRAVIAMREIKSDVEIEEISKACDIGYLMHTAAMDLCREGVLEHEISGKVEGIALTYGKGVSFHNIITQRGEILHNHSHNKILKNGSLMLMDAGAWSKSGYCSDFTRTTPVSGKFTPLQRDVYDIVVSASSRAMELLKPEIPYRDVHYQVCKKISEGLKEMGLMKGDCDEAVSCGAHALFMPHGLGHQLGMDVHDMEGVGESFVGYDDQTERSTQFGLSYLRMGKKLRRGHVMTVEPGIYFIEALFQKWVREKTHTDFINFNKVEKMIGFGGIRLEDNVVIEDSGARLLGKKRIPFTATEVEEYLLKRDSRR